ncbi:MAG: S8 family serine peptidase [Candidatus Saccharibacteria bacterium]|nr:S8 family serine peptidase [Candidatus Saccharibacteria bacterium]
MLRKIIWKPSIAGLACSLFILMGGVAYSNQTPRLAEEQTVIVQGELSEASNKQIGKTDYHAVTANIAKSLKATNKVQQIYAAQQYRSMTDDPLEPQDYLTLLDAASLWEETTGSDQVTVAVLDAGVAFEHEDLIDRWFINEPEYGLTASEGSEPNCTSRGLELDKSCNNLDDSGNGLVDDWRGWDFANDDNDPAAGTTNPDGDAVSHGTAVTGMVGATGDNGVGVASVNWNTKILPIQIFNDDGGATTVELAEGLAYAIDMGVDVINMSLGTASEDPVIESLLEDAQEAGIIVVAAAGNCGGTNYEDNGCTYRGQMLFPATSELTIAVGGTDISDQQASFSSEGAMMDIAAPATGNIRTTLYNQNDESGAYSGSISGTSFAAPIMSGMAASLVGLLPEAEPQDIRSMLIDSTTKPSDMSGAAHTDKFGFGRLEPTDAVILAQNCSQPRLSEDINCDGVVDLLDLSNLASQWEIERTGRSDINGAGITDLLDLSLLASSWGESL